jgi:triosephosphate isomerase
MRKPIVAGNWKMNGTRASVSELLSSLKAGIQEVPVAQVVVFPSYVFLEQTQQQLSGTKIEWGAQNVYAEDSGAFTGEISPKMLKEFGCDYVLLGHSERRHIMGETNQEVAAKFLIAGKNGLKPVFCVGETKEEKEHDETYEVIRAQLAPILRRPECVPFFEQAVIAYEPVWAIGTGLTATPEQAQAVHKFIRQELAKLNKNLAEKVRILYGGSVKLDNAAALFAMPDIDGGLIGGASLNAKEFLEIAKLCH